MDQMEEGTLNSALSRLVNYLITNYLTNLYAICIIWNSNDIEPIINSFMKNSNGNFTLSLTKFYLIKFLPSETYTSDTILSAINFGCQAYIVASVVAIKFMDFYSNAVQRGDLRFASNHFIFVPSPEQVMANMVERILEHSVILDVPDILIINQTNDQISYDLFTSTFVGRTNHSAPLYLDTYYGQNQTFKFNADLFPDKRSNLRKRVVRISIINYKPYAIWKDMPPGEGNANSMDSTEDNNLFLDGTECILMLVFCEIYNCTLEAKGAYNDEWGDIYDNFTGFGLLGAVAERKADVGISALYSWVTLYKYLDISMPISRTSITCLAPSPKQLPGFLIPILPFSGLLWFAVFISILFGIISLMFYDLFQNKLGHQRRNGNNVSVKISTIILEVTGMFLSQSYERIVQSVPEMIIIGCILLVSLTMGSVYSGGLSSIMLIPQYEQPIETVHQLSTRNQPWGATDDAWIFSILLATQPDIIHLLNLFRPIPPGELESHSKTGDFSFSVERLPYGHFAIGDYLKVEVMDYLRLMHDDIYYDYCVAMPYKTWPLLPSLNRLILEVFESGIQRYWELQTVMHNLNNKVQLAAATSRDSHSDRNPVRLEISHLLGAFSLLGIGLITSFIVFLIEIILAKRSKEKNNISKN